MSEMSYPELNFTPEQIAALRDFCGLPPGDGEPPAELLLLAVAVAVRDYCGLRRGDRNLTAADIAVVDATRAIIEGDGP
jgi:hypothetical protein